jgi:hypothetical protein
MTKKRREEIEHARLMAREEAYKKHQDDEQAGFESRRYDFPEYQWRMTVNGKDYLRSSKNWNIYSSVMPSQIIGNWNDVEKRIEFVPDLINKILMLEQQLALKNENI